MPGHAADRGGRPPGVPRGTSDAENQLVLLLRRLRNDAGLTVDQVHLRLPDVIGGKKKPGASTLHKRLGGTLLRNNMSLVNAVIAVCVADPEEAGAMREKAGTLTTTSWPPTAPPRQNRSEGTGADDDCRTHLSKLVAVQEQLLEANAALGDALRAKAGAEAALALRQGPGEAELAGLERQVLVTAGQRDAALQAAQEGQRRISALEALLAAAQRQSPAGHPARRPAPAPRCGPPVGEDGDIATVQQELKRLDPHGQGTTAVLAQAMERLLDGEHTGRFHWDSLSQSEKRTTGQLVENLLRHGFRFEEGSSLDLVIAGVEVDVKVSTGTQWTIPAETVGELCLLVSLDAHRGLWSLGLLRVTPEVLTQGGNRDGKRSLSGAGRKAVTWIHRDVPLPVSVLTTLPQDEVAAILSDPVGQRRLNRLFRAAQRRLVHRSDVATVARQPDAPKRVRDARRMLAEDGILILGHQDEHPGIARDLGLPVPEKGSWVSARLVPAEAASTARSTDLDGTRWRLALPEDPAVPLPRTQR